MMIIYRSTRLEWWVGDTKRLNWFALGVDRLCRFEHSRLPYVGTLRVPGGCIPTVMTDGNMIPRLDLGLGLGKAMFPVRPDDATYLRLFVKRRMMIVPGLSWAGHQDKLRSP